MSVVGDRYAESLFDLAKEENKVTQYLDDIKLFERAVKLDKFALSLSGFGD